MKIFTGVVINTKMPKTATVGVMRIVVDPLYKKRYKKIRKYHVHDELGVKPGDVVKFVASKPYSKLKRWKISEVVGKEKSVKKESKKL